MILICYSAQVDSTAFNGILNPINGIRKLLRQSLIYFRKQNLHICMLQFVKQNLNLHCTESKHRLIDQLCFFMQQCNSNQQQKGDNMKRKSSFIVAGMLISLAVSNTLPVLSIDIHAEDYEPSAITVLDSDENDLSGTVTVRAYQGNGGTPDIS